MIGQRILIIAGPNGAGKTTFARAFLPEEASCARLISSDIPGRRGRLDAVYNNAGDEPLLLDWKDQ